MSLSRKFLRKVKDELKQNVFAQKKMNLSEKFLRRNKGLKQKVFAQSKK